MSLRTRAFDAVRWTSIAAAGKALFAFIQLLILARLLEPKDFGLFALVMAVVNTAQIISDFGISNAIVHYDDVNKRELSSLYWLNLGMGAILTLLLALSSPLLASFFNAPELVLLVAAASIFFIISAFGQQFRALAEKQLKFRRLAIIELSAYGSGLVAAVCTALLQFGAASIVIGFLTTAVVNSALVWLLLSSGCRPTLDFKWSDVGRFWRYGSQIVAVNIVNTLTLQADVVIAGRFFSSATLGYYAQPRDFGLRIMFAINPIITRVAFPLISIAKVDLERVRTIYLSTVRMTASVNFPIFAALATLAPDFVVVVFGDKWLPSAELLRWLALWCAARSVGNPIGSLLFALGQTKRAFATSVINLASLTLAGLTGVQFGPTGLAVSAFAYYCLSIFLVWFIAVRPSTKAGLGQYLSQLSIPAFNSALAAGAALLSITSFSDPFTRLGIGGAVGGVIYIALSAVTNREWIAAIISVLKGQRII